MRITRRHYAINHEEKAVEWMDDNPTVMDMFRKYAKQMANRNRRFGVGLLAERVRWECAFNYPDDDYKINNNYRAYIARQLIREMPILSEFIVTRRTACVTR